MSKNTKTVSIVYFRIEPLGHIAKRKENLRLIADGLKDWSGANRPLPHSSGPIVLHEWKRTANGKVLGAVFHNHENNLPPGYNPRTKQISDLKLGKDQGLGYSTCFMYCPSTSVVAIETMQHSISISRLLQFIAHNFPIPPIQMGLILRPDKVAELNKFDSIRKVEVKISAVDNGEVYAADGRSANEIVSIMKKTNAQFLHVKASMRSTTRTMDKRNVQSMIKDIFKRNSKHEVKTLLVSGTVSGQDEALESETLNFINIRMKDDFEVVNSRYADQANIDIRFNSIEACFAKRQVFFDSAYSF